MKIKSVVDKLSEMEEAHPNTDVVLVIEGVAFPINDIWWEPDPRGVTGVIYIGDDF